VKTALQLNQQALRAEMRYNALQYRKYLHPQNGYWCGRPPGCESPFTYVLNAALYFLRRAIEIRNTAQGGGK
jgi:hypothetical protein